jgi:hypothetical protein
VYAITFDLVHKFKTNYLNLQTFSKNYFKTLIAAYNNVFCVSRAEVHIRAAVFQFPARTQSTNVGPQYYLPSQSNLVFISLSFLILAFNFILQGAFLAAVVKAAI